MTNPDNLTAWKAGLLGELMLRTRAHFRGETVDDASDTREREARDKIVQLATGDGAVAAERARAIVAGIDPRLLTQLTPRQAARHVRLVATTQAKAPPVALEVHCFPMKG